MIGHANSICCTREHIGHLDVPLDWSEILMVTAINQVRIATVYRNKIVFTWTDVVARHVRQPSFYFVAMYIVFKWVRMILAIGFQLHKTSELFQHASL